MTRVVWAIGGSDPSGGAGVAADVKTLTALDVHGACVLTAVTAQGMTTFGSVKSLGGSDIRAQIRSLADLPTPAAIKIGMLPTAEVVREVAHFCRDHQGFVILDPVLRSSSGGALADPEAVAAIASELLPRADLVTPNAHEAAALTGAERTGSEKFPALASTLLAMGARQVLIKGGHCEGVIASDYFRSHDGRAFWLNAPRIDGAGVRGTGCALASAIAAGIARGLPFLDALVLGKAYVVRGIRLARALGDGPRVLHHDAWPVAAVDFPWISSTPSAKGEAFSSTGPEPLGFYPVVPSAAWVERLVQAGAKTVQLRVKSESRRLIASEIAAAARAVAPFGARLFVNDHWREAIEARVYGVHLGQEDLPHADLAAIRRAGLRLGVSTHSLEELAIARGLQPSYVALGPIFPTTCKAMRFGPQGLPRIAEWHALTEEPLVAIGGLKAEHAAEARRLGANGVAVISDVLENSEPEARATEWRQAFRAGGLRHDDRLSQPALSEA